MNHEVKKEKFPLISIVTLCFKSQDYIFECINSVLNQSYCNIEYIIADDGTPNFPYEEVNKFIMENKKSNLKSYKINTNKVNLGIVKNLNNAYKEASGEILMPLSADDVFANENVVERIVQRMIETDSNLLICRRILCDEKLRPIRRMPCNGYLKSIIKLNTPLKQYKALITDNFYEMASGSVMYIRKKMLCDVGYFDEDYTLWEDGPLLTKYTDTGNLIDFAYDIDSIKYRQGGISTKKKIPNLRLENDWNIFVIKERIKKLHLFNLYQRRRIRYIYTMSKVKRRIGRFVVYLKYIDITIIKIVEKIVKFYYIKQDNKNLQKNLG